MNHFYILWENTSANAIGEFATEQDAYAFIRRAAAEVGVSEVSTYLLSRESDDADFEPELVAEGEALVDRALAAVAIMESKQTARRTA